MNIWILLGAKKAMEHEGDDDTNCGWYTWDNPKRIGKETERLRNRRISKDHPNYSITKINQNTEKSPGDLRKLKVTQTNVDVKNTLRSWIIIWNMKVTVIPIVIGRLGTLPKSLLMGLKDLEIGGRAKIM